MCWNFTAFLSTLSKIKGYVRCTRAFKLKIVLMAQHSRHQPSSCNNKRRDIGLVWFWDLILLKKIKNKRGRSISSQAWNQNQHFKERTLTTFSRTPLACFSMFLFRLWIYFDSLFWLHGNHFHWKINICSLFRLTSIQKHLHKAEKFSKHRFP